MNRGEHTLLIYDRPSHDRTELVLPVTVVEDTLEKTSVYVRAGTPTLTYTTAEDKPVSRDIPYKELASLKRELRKSIWKNTNVLICWKPEWTWDVRLMWNSSTSSFLGWYMNIQSPVQRITGGFRTTDHFLDIVAMPDGRCVLKDEDELEDAFALGMYSDSEYDQIHASANQAIQYMESGEWPFTLETQPFLADPEWSLPGLPTDHIW